MNIVLFAHPNFLDQQSMPRFLQMLQTGFSARGHHVIVLRPEPVFFDLPLPVSFKKWLGYIDQFVVFPRRVKRFLKSCPPQTLFVFTDHALGPWMSVVAKRPTVIHCHDFLAQRSALGEFQQNQTSFTGRLYQKFIRNGYRHGQNFISVSQKTQADLHRFLTSPPKVSEVVYNGFNQVCHPLPASEARKKLLEHLNLEVGEGYFLHVGGNDWYKNRTGVIEMYTRWRANYGKKLPMLLVGKKPSTEITELATGSPYGNDIHFLTGLPDEGVRTAYSGATALLFPSLAEGFGWPIAEAMACGCPVITTNEPPMSEVAGDAGFLIPVIPIEQKNLSEWCDIAAKKMQKIAELSGDGRDKVINAGILNAQRFETSNALDKIENIYQCVVQSQKD